MRLSISVPSPSPTKATPAAPDRAVGTNVKALVFGPNVKHPFSHDPQQDAAHPGVTDVKLEIP